MKNKQNWAIPRKGTPGLKKIKPKNWSKQSVK